ncbi:hypothetical protein RF11_08613 [Thelohanellus kitauei]|uniref:Reverse transcriptase zinc-binding domain-containing protein n=1 Tax=Thelohanellus kitauei TaxID=669202 RepID=A0A0C2IHK1_THEKT|nr:hypothetical protein RF11_08613 [Thelohanellus kitauei]
MACRLCGSSKESLPHILNACLVNKSMQTARHNRVIKTLLGNYHPGPNTTIRENKKYIKDCPLRHDILIRTNEDGDEDFLIDVIVSYDHEENLIEAMKSKIMKFNPLATLHMEKYGKPLRILPLVVGFLG